MSTVDFAEGLLKEIRLLVEWLKRAGVPFLDDVAQHQFQQIKNGLKAAQFPVEPSVLKQLELYLLALNVVAAVQTAYYREEHAKKGHLTRGRGGTA